MKKLLSTILLLIAVTLCTNAAKSNGKAHVFTQPDGTSITVKLLGDEHFHWYQTVDGVILSRINGAFYIANITGSGSLESSGILAHNKDARPAKESEAASAQNLDIFFSEADNALTKARNIFNNYPSSTFCPHSGNVKIPIILMNFTDTTFVLADNNVKTEDATKTDELKKIFDTFFNSTTKTAYTSNTRYEGYSSVHQFFADASDDKLNLSFDIYGPYTTKHNHAYYGDDNSRVTIIFSEAIKAANNDIDFSQYDSNNDGCVDMVYIVFAGTGANLSGNGYDIWSSCYYDRNYSADNMKIKVIGCSNELATYDDGNGNALRSGIGVMCHEMSHGLGLPDLYWTLSTKPLDTDEFVDYNNCGPEEWDLMDGGENLYNGMWPCQYTAWEREILGWRDLTELTEPANVVVYPSNKNKATSYKVTNPANKYEYYTIENLPTDEWDYYINARIGCGLMITHINASSSGFSMNPNNTYGSPRITILPADDFILASFSEHETIKYKGEIVDMPSDYDDNGNKTNEFSKNYFIPDEKGDPYPNTIDGKVVNSVAAYKNYTGDDMVATYPITDITRNSDGSISFKFMGGIQSAISEVSDNAKTNDNRIYTIEGRYVGTSKEHLSTGLYIMNGKKFVK